MKTKTFKVLFASVFLFGLILLVHSPQAFAATKTWTGTAGDHKFSTGSNWGGSAPSNGDDLVFPNGVSDKNPTNDLSSASFASIAFTGSSGSGFSIGGNAFTLTGAITDSVTNDVGNYISVPITLSGDKTINVPTGHYLFIGDFGGNALAGSGNIIKTGSGAFGLIGSSNSYTGNVTVNGGSFDTEVAAMPSAGTTVNDGADILISECSGVDINKPLTLTGASSLPNGDDATPKLTIGAVCMGGGGGGNYYERYGHPTSGEEYTFSGTLTLGSDVTLGLVGAKTTVTGQIVGSYALVPMVGYGGVLVVNSSTNGSTTPNGTYRAETLVKTLSNEDPSTDVYVNGNTVVTITGKRGNISLTGAGATLKGTGTVGTIYAGTGTKVAPGLSPGCLSSGNVTFTSGAIYEAELGGTTACSGYDQLKVTGTVDLGSSTLSTSLYNNFKPAKGNSFTIIDNDGTDAITGTFANLAEGATFAVNGYVFKISYVGGTGNDVVLTVQSVPAAPDTGLALLKANPLASLAVTGICGGAILGIARWQRRFATKQSR